MEAGKVPPNKRIRLVVGGPFEYFYAAWKTP